MSLDIHGRALALGTSTLYEAAGLPCAIDPAIRPVWTGAAVAGPAYPVHCSPGDNLAIHLAVERAPRGSVLVVSADGFVAAQAAGISGLVIDGGVRDVAALARRVFPVFSRGISVRGTVKASAPSVGGAIRMTGVDVALGDLVVADDDGVVVLPAAEVPRVLLAGEARAAKEADFMQRLAEGATTVDLLGLAAWRGRA
jgi:4-hydroxy-4-methyl-2-oxoglutarate aldolase